LIIAIEPLKLLRMKTLLFCLTLGLWVGIPTAQAQFAISEEMIWEALNDLKVEEDAQGMKPIFSERVLKLEGKEVSIRGVILEEQIQEGHYTLYHQEVRQDMCRGFDVGQAIEFPAHPKIKKGDIVTIKGILRLNRDNRETLVYQLEGVELLKKHYE
jgi:hypothetical protein